MTEIIAHRGARSLAPENTLAAAKTAWQSGAHRWETDIQVTRDGHPVLFHDAGLLRCTNAKTRFAHLRSDDSKKFLLSQFTLAQLKELDAGSWFAKMDPFSTIQKGYVTQQALAGFMAEKIPTLEEGLLLTKSLDWKINLELKDHGTDPVSFHTVDTTLAAVDAVEIRAGQVVISSFNHEWLDRVRHLRPDIHVQALVGESADNMEHFTAGRFSAYNINADLVNLFFVQNLVTRGFEVNLFTVNDLEAASRFIQAGAKGIITDFPQILTKRCLY
ncbi:MAG: hypothetical protein LC660_11225 [Desulfobacteraceae bacterium]|nr:hypothetical protein [Desulfobacteraceae bacterium]